MTQPPPPEPRSRLEVGPISHRSVTVDRQALSTPSRQALAAPVVISWDLVRRLGVFNLGLLAVVNSRVPWNLTVPVAPVVIAAGALVIWARYRYWIQGEELVTESGVFSRKRVTVPLDRIQSVSTRRSVLHRIFDLVEVRVHTAGSNAAEITLAAVKGEVADRLRRVATAAAGVQVTDTAAAAGPAGPRSEVETGPGGPPAPPVPVLRRRVSELVKAALSRNPATLFAPLALVLGLFFQAGGWFTDWVESLFDLDGIAITILVAMAVVGLVVSAVASILAMVLRFYDMTLVRHGSSFRQTNGLLTRHEFSATIERIQGVVQTQNPVERALGFGQVRLPVAGRASAETPAGPFAQGASDRIDLPGTTTAEHGAIAAIVFGAEATDPARPPVSEGIARVASWRWTLWFGVVPGVALAVFVGLVGAAVIAIFALVWIAIVWLCAERYQRSWSWSIGDELLGTEKGLISRRTVQIAVRKSQTVTLRQGIFHRRHGLADVIVRTAGRVSLVIPMLPMDRAAELRDLLIYRAETDPRPFM